METRSRPLLRLAPWLVLLVLAYGVGRWGALPPRDSGDNPPADDASARGAADSTPPAPTPEPIAPPEDAPEASAEDKLRPETDRLLAAARTMLSPDAATMAFFEKLDPAEAALVARHVAAQPPGSERDLFLLAAIGRWGELDAPAALAFASDVTPLPQRAAARAAVYQAWGTKDASAAFAHALNEERETDRRRALAALLGGAAVAYPGGAITLWEGAPAGFRESAEGRDALQRIVSAATGTGQRAALQAIIQGLPAERERVELTVALARDWGVHDPEGAVAWLRTVTPAGPALDSMIDEVFAAFVRRDPVRAAAWGARETDERRRTQYVGTAVAEWAAHDSAAAETWVNEQPGGGYLDGAVYAIAAHFIEHRELPEAFAWTRRIVRNETRAELLGNLGRIWQENRPDEFATFLAEKSLNPFELEMLKSKLNEPAASR